MTRGPDADSLIPVNGMTTQRAATVLVSVGALNAAPGERT